MNSAGQKKEQTNASQDQKPLSFDGFDLLPEIKQAIDKLGFKAPTPIQTDTYHRIMAGEDIIAMAQTGTGKTAAFGIPMAQKLSPQKNDVQALVLTPTRELALQVCKELCAIGETRGITSAAVYGGASFTKQVSEVKEGAKIVAGTPGRVLDHIRRGTISFGQVEILVLDEADEMLSMGFEKEISQIMEALPKKRQNLLFSATIPDDIRRLTSRYMGEAAVISVSSDGVAAAEISHFVYLVSGQGRPKDMIRVMEAEQPESAIIFCNTRDETQTVAKHLQNAGYSADWLNSDLSQHEREEVMGRIRDGRIKFLVATDVAARGIDVSNLSHVMNYTFPESLEVYVHRTGRTGRMGKHGTAVSLIAPHDIGNLYYMRLAYNIHPLERTFPDEAGSALTLEIARMKELRKAYTRNSANFSGLARRIVQSIHAEQIISGLLADRFGAGRAFQAVAQSAPADTEIKKTVEEKPRHEERAPKKQAKKHTAKSTDRSEKKELETKNTQPSEKKPEEEAREPEPEAKSSQTNENSIQEIYIDAGRKDGLRIAHIMEEIVRLTGLPRSALGKVRMLTRSTFITVPKEHMETVIQTIGKIDIDNRKLKAEPARHS